MPEHDKPALARRLGTSDAVLIGLGAMIGAGVFAAFGPAARAAGAGLLIGLVVAALIAYCNAVASAQLAAVYPSSGGTYLYGRKRLGPWWGFAAGWGFVVGKTAALTRILVATTLTALSVLVVGIAVGGDAAPAHLGGWSSWTTGGAYGILQAAGLLFFAFAGYARIATLGEEVRDPARTIPRAIPLALFITVAVYLLVGTAALLAAGPDGLARAAAPLAAAVREAGAQVLAPVVRIGGAVAALGALLALIAGIGRTGLAMARNRDLPGQLAAVHPRFQVPHHAELALAALVSLLVLTVDLRGVIGFSSFGVLIYYAIANASAFTQPRDHRRWPRGLNLLGITGCLVLVVTLPWQSVVAGAGMFAAGLLGRLLILHRRQDSHAPPGTG